MPVTIQSICKAGKTRSTGFDVVFCSNGHEYRTLATVLPKRGNAVTFADPAAKRFLLNAGRPLRHVCQAILDVRRGKKMQFPITVPEDTAAHAGPIPFTIPQGTVASKLLKVG